MAVPQSVLLMWVMLLPLVQGYCGYCDLYIYESPLSMDTVLGNSTEFNCNTYIYSDFHCYLFGGGLVVSWLINGSTMSYNTSIADYYYEEATYSNDDGNINITTLSEYNFLYSTLHIQATAANSSTEIQCEIHDFDCEQSTTSPIAMLRVQGFLEAPSNLQLTEMNSETIGLSWDPPFTLAGVPILQYSVYVDDFTLYPENTITVETTTSTQHFFRKPCSSIRYSVSGWNELGEGAHSASVEYTSETLAPHYMAVSAPNQLPGTICVPCSFTNDSQAQGCHGEIILLSSIDLEVLFNITRGNLETLTVLDCITGLKTGNYSVEVGEIECTGHHGPTYIEWHDIAVIELSPDQTESTPTPSPSPSPQPSSQPALVDDQSPAASTNADSSAVTGLAVVTALLGVALGALITIVLVFVTIKFLRRHNSQKATVTSKVPEATPSTNTYAVGRDESAYETIDLTPLPQQNTPGPPTENYENVQFSPPPQASPAPPPAVVSTGIDLGPCSAYGLVRRQ